MGTIWRCPFPPPSLLFCCIYLFNLLLINILNYSYDCHAVNLCLTSVSFLLVEAGREKSHGELQLNSREQESLRKFLGKSVTAGTLQGYVPGWEKWQTYLRDRDIKDPFLDECTEIEKVSHLCNFFRVRYEEGKRGKAAYGIGAAIRKFFAVAMRPLCFFDNPITSAARRACRMSTNELRELQRKGGGNDKLPAFMEMIVWIRDNFWENKGWHNPEIDMRMIAIAALTAFDLADRGGEITTVAGALRENHSIANDQVSFRLEDPVMIRGVECFAVAAGSEEFRRQVLLSNVASCEIEVSSHKSGPLGSHNKKVIGRTNDRESEFLDDLFEWCKRSGATSHEPLFSRRVWTGKKVTFKKLHPKMLSEAIKSAATHLGLDPTEFSNHSLRKGAVTQMKASGCSREETKARGNYSKDSIMIDSVYNHDNTGRGPLAASSSGIGREVTKVDVMRHSKSARFR